MYFTTKLNVHFMSAPPTFTYNKRCYVPGFSYNIVHTCTCTWITPPLSPFCPLKFLSGTGYDINKVWPTFTLILVMATLRSVLFSNAFNASNLSYLVCRGFRNRCLVNSLIPSASGKSFSPIPESFLKSKVFC